MAARRLVIVMLVLLGLSTLAAAVVPAPEDNSTGLRETVPADRGERTRDRNRDRADDDPREPELVREHIHLDGGRPATIRLRPGDQLNLIVTADSGDNIVLPDFGLTETVSPYGPARFDVLVEDEGDYEVRALDAGEVVATIHAGTTPPVPPGASRREGGRGSSRSSGKPRPDPRGRQGPRPRETPSPSQPRAMA